MALCISVVAQLIEHGALHIQNPPIRIVGRMCTIERLKRLLVLTGFSQCAAVGAEQWHAARVTD